MDQNAFLLQKRATEHAKSKQNAGSVCLQYTNTHQEECFELDAWLRSLIADRVDAVFGIFKLKSMGIRWGLMWLYD